MFKTQSTHAPAAGFAIDTLARNLVSRAAALGQRRRMTRLLDLDDHMLDDIGVTRGEIQTALSLPLSVDAGVALRRASLERRRRRM